MNAPAKQVPHCCCLSSVVVILHVMTMLLPFSKDFLKNKCSDHIEKISLINAHPHIQFNFIPSV